MREMDPESTRPRSSTYPNPYLPGSVCEQTDLGDFERDGEAAEQTSIGPATSVIEAPGCEVLDLDQIGDLPRGKLREYARGGLSSIMSSLGVERIPDTESLMSPVAEVITGLITADYAETTGSRSSAFQVVVDPGFYRWLSLLTAEGWKTLARWLTDGAKSSWKLTTLVSGSDLNRLFLAIKTAAQQMLDGTASRTISPDPPTRPSEPHPRPSPRMIEPCYKLEDLRTTEGFGELSRSCCGGASVECPRSVLLVDPPYDQSRYRSLMSDVREGVWYNLDTRESFAGTPDPQRVVLDRARILFEDPLVLQRIGAEFCVVFEAELFKATDDSRPTALHQRRSFFSPEETVAEISRALGAGKGVRLVYASAKQEASETEEEFQLRMTRLAEDKGWRYGWYKKGCQESLRCFVYM